MTATYEQFLDAKTQLDHRDGFPPVWAPDWLFDFQSALVDWSIRQGRAAIFADCGLGKTPMQLVWAENVHRHTNKPVLLVTPLAVGAQTIVEAAKFDIEAHQSRDGTPMSGITVTNYEQLEKFTPSDFGGLVCDESSAIKSFDGVRRLIVTEFARKMRYRLLCTATAAPNDYIELGTSSEALGYLGHLDMLGRFFKNDQGNTVKTNRNWQGAKWRFKGHAEEGFWRWVCSWARALRRPSDLGFDDTRFALPDLIERDHLIESRTAADGMLFTLPAVGLREERDEMRRTVTERCETMADLVADDQPAVVWCHLNAEGDLLERLIPGCVQVSGDDPLEEKEAKLTAFSRGEVRVLVTKPRIGGWGLNWQHCAHAVYCPSHSFEQYYQAIRRCWRFGQSRPVVVDVVTTDAGMATMKNLQRKAVQSDRMFAALVRHMANALTIHRTLPGRQSPVSPSWMESLG